MKRRLFLLLLAGVMGLSSGCSANVSVDPDTGVVAVNGVSANELMKEIEVKDKSIFSEADKTGAEDNEAENTETDDGTEMCDCGIKVTYPEAFRNSVGLHSMTSEYLGNGLYCTAFIYKGVTKEWFDEAFSTEEASKEDLAKFKNSTVVLTSVFTIDKARGIDDLIECLKEEGEDPGKDEFETLEKIDDCTFFRYSGYDKKGYDGLDDDFKEDFDVLYDAIDDLLSNIEYFKPVSKYADLIGKKLDFTTSDIDRNKITGKELFSQHEITMVNVWATWCHWCVKELPELEEINKRLTEKDCAIVGLVDDGNDDESI